jgi:CCR4-NOT transcription complex subunit 4
MPANAVPAQAPKPAKTEEAQKKKEKAKEKDKEKEKEKDSGKDKKEEKDKGKEKEKEKGKGKDKEKDKAPPAPATTSAPEATPPVTRTPSSRYPALDGLLRAFMKNDFIFTFCASALSDEDLKAVQEFPPLFEVDGAFRRRAIREAEKQKAKELEAAAREAELKTAQAEAAVARAAATAEPEETNETTAGGSLQLGGEPEERHETGGGQGNRNAIAPPGQNNLSTGPFGQNSSLADDFANLGIGRTLTPQQQQQLLLSSLKSGNPQSAGLQSNFGPQNHVAPGHTRHTSRFSFANDSSSASASVQPVANQKLMNQQSAMMPKSAGPFSQMSQHQPLASQFYTSGVQGPPPGLKATGTPPVSGGGMFAQGHGFATGGLAYGSNTAGRANNGEPIYQDLLRGRNLDGGARLADAGKRESMFPTFLNHPTTSTPGPTPGAMAFPYGPSPGAYQETGTQKSKKKGKKHRHANTSSSGGGVVDVQDPSILQARLHQGSGMVNQGLYAGQGQGGFSSLYANNYGGATGRW